MYVATLSSPDSPAVGVLRGLQWSASEEPRRNLLVHRLEASVNEDDPDVLLSFTAYRITTPAWTGPAGGQSTRAPLLAAGEPGYQIARINTNQPPVAQIRLGVHYTRSDLSISYPVPVQFLAAEDETYAVEVAHAGAQLSTKYAMNIYYETY